jgi:hypothetical protein
MLMMILLYFSLKVADVSLSESGHLVPWWLTPHTTLVRPSQPWLKIAAQQSSWAVAGEYTVLGTEHILFGVDHLLFVLALLIITRSTGVGVSPRPGRRGRWNRFLPGLQPSTIRLVKTITAFTAAHSITLGLATLGFVNVPQRPIEAIIALSIVLVAAEIIHSRRGVEGITARAPWVVAFAFGLLHGFGFASALSGVGLPSAHIPVALLFFNLGVEVGQLVFIATVLALMTFIRRVRSQLPPWVDLVPPYAIGSVAMFWVIERAASL